MNPLEQIIQLQADNQRLREALEFYQKEDHYLTKPAYRGGPLVVPEVMSDRGAIARVAIMNTQKQADLF